MIYEKDIINMQCSRLGGARNVLSDLCKCFTSFFSLKISHHS